METIVENVTEQTQEIVITKDDSDIVYFSPLRMVDSLEALSYAKHNACFAVKEAKGWMLHVTVFKNNGQRIQTVLPINEVGPGLRDEKGLIKWGVVRLGLDVWALTDSLFIDSNDNFRYHGYLVIIGVDPTGAPWQK